MRDRRLFIVGAGGFGREVAAWAQDWVQAEPGWRVAGFLDARKDALKSFPSDLEVLGDNGSPESGITYLEEARRLDPLSPIILVDLATAYDQAGRWDDADRLFEEVLELEPDFAPAFSGLFAHAVADGDPQGALAYLQRFL